MALFGNRNTLREAREERRMMEPPAGMRQALNIGPVIRDAFGTAIVINRKVDGKNEYLHKDGIWRSNCQNEKKEWTGFYKTKKEAEYFLDTVLCGYVI
jgi:hypothetical protein